MSKASPKKFQECYAAIMLKLILNLSTTYAHGFQDPRKSRSRGVDYKISCLDCNFVYYGQTDRALATRIKQQWKEGCFSDSNFKIAQQAKQFVHNINFGHATIVYKGRDYHKRLFLADLAEIYKSLKPVICYLAQGSFVTFCPRSTCKLWTVNACGFFQTDEGRRFSVETSFKFL